MKKLIYLFALPLFVMACDGTEETTTEATTVEMESIPSADVDELNEKFVTAWNAGDSTQLMAIMADDVEMLIGPNTLSGKDAVVSRWMRTNLNTTKDLNTSVKAKGEGSDMAYTLGTYTIVIEEPNQESRQEKGNYTFVWEPQEDNNWKIVTMHIESVPEEQAQ